MADTINKQTGTPWGGIQTLDRLGEGIYNITTAGHGGIWLSPARRREIAEHFPNFTPWTGSWQWLEEDCDYQLALWFFYDLLEVKEFNFDRDELAARINAYQPYFAACATIIANDAALAYRAEFITYHAEFGGITQEIYQED